MKRWVFLFLTMAPCAIGADSAELRLQCYSPMIDPATTRVFGNSYHLAITSAGPGDAPNGEMAPADQQADYTHTGVMLMTADVFGGETIPLPFRVDVPLTDADQDEIPDIFQTKQGVSGQTTGVYDSPLGESEMRVRWTRSAGSATGTCRIELPDFGVTFNHVLHTVEYAGTYTYAREGQDIVGQVELRVEGSVTQTLEGELRLTPRVDGSVFWARPLWRDENGLEFTFESGEALELDGLVYWAYFVAEDGVLATPPFDYNYWIMLLETKDENGNGTPDLIEQPQAERPRLGAIRNGNSFEIHITGTVGQSYTLEAANDISQAQWDVLQTVNLTTSPMVLSMAFDGTARFFRLKQ